MSGAWQEALAVDPQRRDREAALTAAVTLAMQGQEPAYGELPPEQQRRLGYLVELGQVLRGQTEEEAHRMAALRHGIGLLSATSFWPDERAVPPGTNQIAEAWGYHRGCDLLRLRKALHGRLTCQAGGESPAR